MYLLKKKMYSALWTEIFLRGFCKNQSEYQSDPEINVFVHLLKKKTGSGCFHGQTPFYYLWIALHVVFEKLKCSM